MITKSDGSLKSQESLSIDFTSPVVRFREGNRNRTVILDLPKLTEVQSVLSGTVSSMETWNAILDQRLWSIQDSRELHQALTDEITKALGGTVYPVPVLDMAAVRELVVRWYRANLSLDRLRLIYGIGMRAPRHNRLTGENEAAS